MDWKKLLLYIGIPVIIIAIGISLFLYITKDNVSVFYRTYTNEDGWSKWSKTGEVSGNDHYITAMQFKVKSRLRGVIYYTVSKGEKEEFFKYEKEQKNGKTVGNKKDKIKSLIINFSEKLYKKYELQYRTYTKENKWSEWFPSGASAIQTDKTGNKIYCIRKIQVRIKRK